MAARLVVVGASAGGVGTLVRLARDLPADFPAPIVVVLHVPAQAPSALPEILSRAGSLPARQPEDGEALEPGTIYVAPPDRHVLVRDGRLRVVRGPRENGHRPAIDPLFRSAAASRGPDVVAVVLSGVLDDGAAGAVSVSRHGGVVVVQDPADAPYGDMPRFAIADDSPEAVLPVAEMAAYLARVVREPARANGRPAAGDLDELETRYAELDDGALGRPKAPGELANLSCPACGGVLTEADDEDVIRFRCRVGHAYGGESLLAQQELTTETALWTALRALEERADLSRLFARRLRRNDLHARAERAEAAAGDDDRQAEVVRALLRGDPGLATRAEAAQ